MASSLEALENQTSVNVDANADIHADVKADAVPTAGTDALLRTPLYDLHLKLGAKMVPFAGYDMPVQYPMGVMGEHLHTRQKAGLFDVSHMGQARLSPVGHDADAPQLLEQLVPGGLQSLKEGHIRYTQLTDASGGILDDLMVTRFGRDAWLVVNAACKGADFTHIAEQLAGQAGLDIAARALLALQGPAAERVLATLIPAARELAFMQAAYADWQGVEVLVSRCGYTGEDGFEISLPEAAAVAFAEALLADADVAPIGLGARDSLRLEAGLCLYGHDIDRTTSPVEADLLWTIPARRRAEGGYPGAEIILSQINNGPARKRVGLLPDGRAPAREGAEIQSTDGVVIGRVTSGGFGPSAEAPVSMGYVTADHASAGNTVNLIVRGKALPAKIVALPFVPHRYRKHK